VLVAVEICGRNVEAAAERRLEAVEAVDLAVAAAVEDRDARGTPRA
jgi:hypothetical protein